MANIDAQANRRGLVSQKREPRVNPFVTGSLLGLGAALVGVSPILAGLRPWHLLVLAAFVLVIANRGLGALLALRITAVDLVFLLFILLSASVEYLNASQLSYEPDLFSVFSDVFYVLAYLTARLSIGSQESCAAFLRGIVWPAVPVSLLALMQILGVGVVVRLSLAIAPAEAVDNRFERGDFVRAWGLTGHWTGFGGYLTCIVAAIMCLVLIEHKTSGMIRKVNIILLGLVLLGVLSTLTISVLFASMAIILVSWRRLRAGIKGLVAFAVLAGIAVLALAPFIADRLDQQFVPESASQTLPGWVPSTLAYRWVIWQRDTVPAILERPFLGWGSGAYSGDTVGRQYPRHLTWLSAESQWLGMAVGYGIWVAMVFAILILMAGFVLRRSSVMSSGDYLEPLFTLWITLLMTSFTVSIFTNRGTPATFYILLGVAVGVRELKIKTTQRFHQV